FRSLNTALGEVTWKNGLGLIREHASAQQFADSTTGGGGWNTFGPSGVRLMASAYTSASLKATDWLTLQGGLRYDRYNTEGEGYLAQFPERSGGRASPDAAVIVTPVEGVQLFAKYAEGYRPPSLRESHWKYQGLLTNNPDLDPEISKNIEIGLNILRDGVLTNNDQFRFKASYFRNRYDDYIVRGLVPGGNPNAGQSVYHWNNIDHANYEGIELSASYDARKWFVEGVFNKYFTVEYCPAGVPCLTPAMGGFGGSSDPLRNDYTTNYIPPEYSGSVTAGVRLFDEMLTLGGRMHFASVRFGSSWSDAIGRLGQVGNQFTWPRYTVFDVFGSYKLSEDATLNWSVENITDEYYYGALSTVGIPSPGRTARVSLTRTLDGDMLPSVPDLTLGRASEGAPGSNWTGLYFGAHVGYGLASISGTTTAGDGTAGGIPGTESADVEGKDPLRGGQIGLNYQFGNGIVVGLEGDFSWMTSAENRKAVATEGTLGQRDWLQAETDYEFDWMATVRGRIGYSFDRWLVYGTAGLAFLKEEQTRTQFRSNPGSASSPYGTATQEFFQEKDTALRQGWTVGGGFEYALTNRWSLKGEYLYSGFGKENFLFPEAREGVGAGYCPTVAFLCTSLPNLFPFVPGNSDNSNGRRASNDLDLHTVKLGINYRF
ncbi:MAG: TonB-dependent receptor, partial [Hyphomicrobiaceae bacterium]